MHIKDPKNEFVANQRNGLMTGTERLFEFHSVSVLTAARKGVILGDELNRKLHDKHLETFLVLSMLFLLWLSYHILRKIISDCRCNDRIFEKIVSQAQS